MFQSYVYCDFTNFYRATARNATHGLARRIPSVCLSVRLKSTRIVTERKKLVSTFLHHMIGCSSSFLTRRMAGGGNRFYLKFWAKLTHPLQKR